MTHGRKGRALMTALAVGVVVVWITSLGICAIVFWPAVFKRWRTRQHQRGAAEEIRPESRGSQGAQHRGMNHPRY
jgi:hypothetical protein